MQLAMILLKAPKTSVPQDRKQWQVVEAEEVSKAAAVSNDTSTVLGQEQSSTLYVKNLNFSTSQSALNELFSVMPGHRNDSIEKREWILKRGFNQWDMLLWSMQTEAEAADALRAYNGHFLDGFGLEITYARRAQLNPDSISVSSTKGNRQQEVDHQERSV